MKYYNIKAARVNYKFLLYRYLYIAKMSYESFLGDSIYLIFREHCNTYYTYFLKIKLYGHDFARKQRRIVCEKGV